MEVTVDREKGRRSGWFRKLWKPSADRQPTGQGATPKEMIQTIVGLEQGLLQDPMLPPHMRKKLEADSHGPIDSTFTDALAALQEAEEPLQEITSAEVQQFIDSDFSPLQRRLFGLFFQRDLSPLQIAERVGLEREDVVRELTWLFSLLRTRFGAPEESAEALVDRLNATARTHPQ